MKTSKVGNKQSSTADKKSLIGSGVKRCLLLMLYNMKHNKIVNNNNNNNNNNNDKFSFSF